MTADPIAHVEMLARERDDASQFYADLFDWKMRADPALNYYQFEAEGGPGGAFLTVKASARPGYVEYRVEAVLLLADAALAAGARADA